MKPNNFPVWQRTTYCGGRQLGVLRPVNSSAFIGCYNRWRHNFFFVKSLAVLAVKNSDVHIKLCCNTLSQYNRMTLNRHKLGRSFYPLLSSLMVLQSNIAFCAAPGLRASKVKTISSKNVSTDLIFWQVYVYYWSFRRKIFDFT